MRKLTQQEQAAVYFIDRDGPLVLGDRARSEAGQIVHSVLDALVRKKRASVEMTDDGPRYSLTAWGREDAS